MSVWLLRKQEAVAHWQFWLLGIQFTILTDRKPLENLKINVRTDEEIGGMIFYLSKYNFNVKYNLGSEIGGGQAIYSVILFSNH